MMKDPVNISAADQALVEEMQMVAQKPEAMDVFLDSILTPDQLAEYSKSKEEQRVSRAEDTAQASVSYFGQQFDLTPLQKDQLFDAGLPAGDGPVGSRSGRGFRRGNGRFR